MIKIAIIDDEKEMSSILSNYVNKYAKEKNIDINMDIFQSSTDFLTNYRWIRHHIHGYQN